MFPAKRICIFFNISLQGRKPIINNRPQCLLGRLTGQPCFNTGLKRRLNIIQAFDLTATPISKPTICCNGWKAMKAF